MKLKTIGLTFDVKEDWQLAPDEPADANAEFDKSKVIEEIVSALEAGGYAVERIGNIDKLMSRLPKLDVDIVFNICEGRNGRNRESRVPMLLEMNNIPYVGSDALTLGMTLDKVVAKKLFISESIPTPKFFVAHNAFDLPNLSQFKFPLIVKTRHEGSSKGISAASQVYDEKSLRQRVGHIIDTYQQPALVEEFIHGTEFTVAVLGNHPPQAQPVVQVSIDGSTELGEKFYTNELIYDEALKYICPAKISYNLSSKLQAIAVKAYQCVECRDFGRVDFRVDKDDNPFVLEINPYPSLDKDDVFNLFPNVYGSDYTEAVCKIIEYGLERYEKSLAVSQ